MKEQLTSIETAKLAKEKGFNIKTHDYFAKHVYDKKYHEYTGYNDDYWGENYEYDWNTNGEPFKPFSKDCYSRPTQSLLQKWLREEHGVDVIILLANTSRHCYIGEIWQTIKNEPVHSLNLSDSGTYEEALEKGLQEALKLI